MLKGRKQSDTYLATIHRHRWSVQMTMKRNIKWSFQPAQWLSSGEEEVFLFVCLPNCNGSNQTEKFWHVYSAHVNSQCFRNIYGRHFFKVEKSFPRRKLRKNVRESFCLTFLKFAKGFLLKQVWKKNLFDKFLFPKLIFQYTVFFLC